MRFSHPAVVTFVALLGYGGAVGAFQAYPPTPMSRTRTTSASAAMVNSNAISSLRMVSSSVENVPLGTLDGPSVTPPDMEAFAAGYFTVFDEVPFKVCTVTEGELPDDLVGSYFRSGPAMFSAGSLPPPKTSIVQPKSPPTADGQDAERMVKHPFEGDGAVLGLTFPGDGTLTARFRFVRTNAFTTERKKGKKMYTAMESTREDDDAKSSMGQGNDFPLPMYKHHLLPGLNKKRKNTSNTRAIYWSKKLLTLWEGGLPYKLDSLALSTEGRSQLGGILKEKDPFGGKASLDSKKDRMLFYSVQQDSGSSEVTIYEFNSKFRLVSEGGGKLEVKMPGFALISDFATTENYSLFVQPPIAANGMQFMLSKEPGKTLKMESKPALLHLVSRVGNANRGGMKTISIPFDGTSDADLQFCNAYEKDDGTIIFDAIRSDGKNVVGGGRGSSNKWPWASSLSDYAATASKKSLWRYTVQPGGSVTKECISNQQVTFGVVNPAVSSQKHRYVYASVGSMGDEVSPPQGIIKIDTETKTSDVWLPEKYEFCGEPMYSPRKRGDDNDPEPSEDDGYIISVLFNGKTRESSLIVLEANNVKQGPVARVNLGVGIPHGYYGCFAASSEADWSAEEIERRAKLSDKMEGRGNMWNEVKSDFSGLGLRLDDIEEVLGDIL
uniref:Uncharacterized protein n=1 Tax=Helicotheca tamesis TaxID=374047 RepID=A0A7S2MAK4_9STRA|mmetsp:Transcript_12610/g.17386  ORF Transcript_12610/g.17386 Transcript_12610/m.17386 type:complete len:666 (+) Transcript_12610:86-2083(+)|eukprot:CAMPEP_0185723978 /NCGR_PEP_ID=MMETSP1171-20130828/616_1 /TAXON_ID=374046 /ORGANISM="Helicotheca tamensis, Strain CCMP826" /LENGTH=665 /DNA_ID=CAMNT_0028391749 /DNA_START=40 /DNA_END=2037 /DNA_ORIENTATION=-